MVLKNFSNNLIYWYRQKKRDLPWRHNNNPYCVWLSEIILQQTRVEQGLPYYEKFIATYPTVVDLAKASLDDVYKLWEGLGYYSRARNLHATAQYVANELGGVFPNTYSELIKLKGVGDYTASAIASFCFSEPTPVLDGNVFRVIARIFDISEPINKPASRKVFKKVLHDLIDVDNPSEFNQAIMEFGAIHCKPKQPLCNTCIFESNCLAFANHKVHELPVKLKAKKSVSRYFNYLVLKKDGKVCITKRETKGIWLNLYEFPLIESKEIFEQELIDGMAIQKVSKPYKHILSHQNIYAKFYWVLNHKLPDGVTGKFITINEMEKVAKHRLMTLFLTDSDWF